MVQGKQNVRLSRRQARIREWQTGIRPPANRLVRTWRYLKHVFRIFDKRLNVSHLGCLISLCMLCGVLAVPVLISVHDANEYNGLLRLVSEIAPVSPSPMLSQPTSPSPVITPQAESATPNVNALPKIVTTPLIRQIQYIPPIPSTPLGELALVSLGALVILPIVVLVIWYALFGPKHVVYAFAPAQEDDKDAVLQALSAQATQMFVKRIREIGYLLSESQAEDMNSRIDNTLSLYVADGTDAAYVNQIRGLSSFEAGSFRFPVGSLILLAQRYLTKTRVRGTIYRLGSNSVEIDIHYTPSTGNSFSVGSILVAQDAPDYYSEAAIRTAIDQLAIGLVHRIGDASVVASSEGALSLFLAGRQASARHNWWHAIAMYRSVTRLEEAHRGLFGRGHFHLGAALAMQGEYAKARDHFIIAEQSGPPIAESLYMHALCLYHINQNDLNKVSPLSNDEWSTGDKIIRLCEQALRLKQKFPEAHHLMGATEYQIGKLEERRRTRRYEQTSSATASQGRSPDRTSVSPEEQIRATTKSYKHHYQQAEKSFARAERLYAEVLDELLENEQSSESINRDRERIFRQWLSVTHQRAASLRSLGKHASARKFYEDVSSATPSNVRNNCGILRNDCLWGRQGRSLREWPQMLDQFAYGHADLNLYYGWALAQQACSAQQLRKLNAFLGRTQTRDANPWWCLHRAFRYLDYAIHERPRFVTRWHQTNWLQPLLEAADALNPTGTSELYKTSGGDTTQTTYASPLINSQHIEAIGREGTSVSPEMVKQILLWLAWRMDSLHFTIKEATNAEDIAQTDHDIAFPVIIGTRHIAAITEDQQSKAGAQDLVNIPSILKTPGTNIYGIDAIYGRLRQLRSRIAKYLKKLDESQIADSLANRWAWSLIAEDAHRLWQECTTLLAKPQSDKGAPTKTQSLQLFDDALLEKLGRQSDASETETKENKVTFAERWVVDLYAEISLTACRTLSECHAFETLHEVAAQASQLIDRWLERHWKSTHHRHGDVDSAKFTQKVMRLQMSSLLAWKSLSGLKMRHDVATLTRMRLQRSQTQHPSEEALAPTDEPTVFEGIQEDIDDALRRHPNHPVAVMAQALLHEQRGALPEAIEELHRLQLILAPLEPDLHTTIWEKRLLKHGHLQDTDTPRSNLYYMARVCGQEQFEGVVHQSRVHAKLADLFGRLNDQDSRIEHLLLALAKSPFRDMDNRCLFNLAEALMVKDRFSEALSVINEMRVGFDQLVEIKHYARSSRQLDVLQGMVTSRLGRSHEALAATEVIARNRDLESQALLDRLKNPNPMSAIMSKGLTSEHQTYPQWNESFKKIASEFIARFANNTPKSASEQDDASVSQSATQLLMNISKCHGAEFLAGHIDMIKSVYVQQFPLLSQPPALGFDRVLLEISQVTYFIVEEVVLALIQICDACNTYAYNQAQLRLDGPLWMSNQLSLQTSPNRLQDDQELTQLMVDIMTGLRPVLGHEADINLAQYYDTQGWSEFIQADNLEKLEQARKTLLLSIKAYPGLAISNYHLARVYFREFQFLWQLELEDGGLNSDNLIKMMGKMREARHHLNEASKLDRNARLNTALSRLGRWMDQYTKRWDELQFDGSRV